MKPLTSRLYYIYPLVVSVGIAVAFGACGRTVDAASGAVAPSPPAERLAALTVLDDFESAGSWSPLSAQGVSLKLGSVDGVRGKALQFDFAFPSPSGYVVAAREIPVDLPDDFKFTFHVKGDCLDNTLEFKIIDKDGNTFWKRFENFSFPKQWSKVSIRKSQIVFAWGPAGGGSISRVAKIEFAVSCGKGGKGTVSIDDLVLVDISSSKSKFPMTATASSMENPGVDASKAVDDDKGSRWASEHKDAQWIELDLGEPRDFVGMTIRWEAAYTKAYDVLVSNDRKEWTRVYGTQVGDGGMDDLYFGRRSARYIKIDAKKRGTEWGNSIYEIAVKGAEEEIVLTASSEQSTAPLALDGDMQTMWRSEHTRVENGDDEWLILDLGRDRDIGGLHIYWDDAYAKNYDVAASSDKTNWTPQFSTLRGNGGRDRLVFKEGEARYVRISCRDGVRGYGIRELELKGSEAAGDQNKTYEIMAEEAPRGFFPKYFSQEATYWTIVGVTEDVKEALFNEEGAFEVDREQFSIEPFLYLGSPGDGRLVTWGDVKTSQFLERGYLPIPEARWSGKDAGLSARLFADGVAGASTLYATYVVTNVSAAPLAGKLFLAIRPFQVNPPWQKLNQVGGVAKIRSITYDDAIIKVNDDQRVLPLSKPDNFGAAAYASGDITEFLKQGLIPGDKTVADQFGFASGALEYAFDLAPGETAAFHLAVPFHKASPALATNQTPVAASRLIADKLAAQIQWWSDRLDRVVFHVPAAGRRYIDVLKSNLAYIFLNRDGFRIQPGSRSYLRSWIRDGALTSAAILRMNNQKEVREYLSWYAKYLFPDGRVPCVVDDRGADGVPENDSNGEFIYGFMQLYRFTGDRTFLSQHFEQIRKAAEFIIAMRNRRKTDEYKNGPDAKRVGFGLVEESISHEGYSAKPVFSLWDDFLCLKGMKDASTICEILGKKDLARKYHDEAEDFRKCILDSIELSQKMFGIDHIPGAVDLGDFDPTATSIALFPCGELDHLPQPDLNITFEKYWKDFEKRLVPGADDPHDVGSVAGTRDGTGATDPHDVGTIAGPTHGAGQPWGEAYTPYEIRNAQSFIIMGMKDRAHKLFGFFFDDMRPSNWNHWSEIVFRDPLPGRWIGDMPHTWLGSDYIKAVRSMFVYERDADQTLVVNAGIPEKWLEAGEKIGIEKAPTYWGALNYTATKEDQTVRVTISGTARPPGGIIFQSPLDRPIKSVKIKGKLYGQFTETSVTVKTLPAEFVIEY